MSKNLIKGITSDYDLFALADIINVNIDGIYTIDEVNHSSIKNKTYILLLRPQNIEVGHWVCVCDGNYFDSMGVGPPQSLGSIPYNQIQYQSAYQEYCGIFCLLFIYCKQKNRMDLLENFNDLDLDVI